MRRDAKLHLIDIIEVLLKSRHKKREPFINTTINAHIKSVNIIAALDGSILFRCAYSLEEFHMNFVLGISDVNWE